MAGIFRMVLPDREVRFQLNPNRLYYLNNAKQIEQSPSKQYSVGEPQMVYAEIVQGGPRGTAIDASAGVPVGAGLW